MKEIFLIKDSVTNKISYYHLLFFLVALPFDRFYSELILISLFIHTLIHIRRFDFKQALNPKALALQAIYITTLICTLYSQDIDQALSDCTKQLAIFLFPLLLFINPIDLKKYKNNLLKAFSLTCVITILYLYFDAFKTLFYYHLPLKNIFTHSFINHNFSLPIELHATYLSMYAALAFVFYLDSLLKRRSLGLRTIFFLFVLIAGLLQLGSRAVCISLLAFILIVVPFYYFTGKRRLLMFVSLSLFLSFALGFILKNRTFEERYIDEFKNDISLLHESVETSDPRVERWALAVQLIEKSPAIGYGTGSEIKLLKEAYFQNHLYSSYIHKLNAHNQYLSFLLKGGIPALLLFLFCLGLGLRWAMQKKDIVFFSFLLLVITVSFGENILDVNKGIFFYSFFVSFFTIAHFKKIKHSEDAKATTRQLQPFVHVQPFLP